MNETLFQILVLTALLWHGILLSRISKKQKTMALTLDDLKTKVQADTDAENSAITLLQGISAQLAAAKNDPAKIQALADQLDSNAANLAAAVIENTPAA